MTSLKNIIKDEFKLFNINLQKEVLINFCNFYLVLRFNCFNICWFFFDVGEDVKGVPVARLSQVDDGRDGGQVARGGAVLNLSPC